jgi:hypothetical protein
MCIYNELKKVLPHTINNPLASVYRPPNIEFCVLWRAVKYNYHKLLWRYRYSLILAYYFLKEVIL